MITNIEKSGIRSFSVVRIDRECPTHSKMMFPRSLFGHKRSVQLKDVFMKCWTEQYAFPASSVYDVEVRFVAHTQRILESFFIRKTSRRQLY